MKILGISGSLRANSYNTSLLRAARQLAPDSVSVEIFDLQNVPLYNEDNDDDKRPAAVHDLLQAIAAADALLFANPEYNHSISGVLKNALDWASRPAFDSVLKNKPAGILSASMSPVGGARGQMHLKDVLASTLTPVFPCPDFLLPMAQNAFDDDNNLIDDTGTRRLKRYLSQLTDWAATAA